MKNVGVALAPSVLNWFRLSCSHVLQSPVMSAASFLASSPASCAIRGMLFAPTWSVWISGSLPFILNRWLHRAAFISLNLPCLAAAHAAMPGGIAAAPWMTRYFDTRRTSLGYFARIWSSAGLTM
jgi:hypothetical protein